MKFLALLFFGFIFASPALALPNVSLEIALTVNGRTVKPLITTPYGKAATVKQINEEGDGVEVTVTPRTVQAAKGAKPSIEMRFVISEVKKHQRKRLSRPRVITVAGQPAILTENSPNREIRLEVAALETP
jgi:hypothetical protein